MRLSTRRFTQLSDSCGLVSYDRGMPPHPQLLQLASQSRVYVTAPDTQHFLENASDQRVLGLVRESLRNGRLDVDDKSVFASFIAADQARTLHNLRRYETYAQNVIQKLRSVGCEPLVIKGWWSMHHLFDQPTDRFTSDIDLVLSPEGTTAHDSIRTILGEPLAPPDILTPDASHGACWTFASGDVAVDIHLNPFTLRPAGAVDKTIWVEFTKPGNDKWASARVPTIELALAIALVNYTGDRFGKLFQMDEIRRLAEHPDLRWDEFWRLTELGGIGRIAKAGLKIVSETLGFDLMADSWKIPISMRPWTSPNVILGRGRDRHSLDKVLMSGHVPAARRAALQVVWQFIVPPPRSLPYYFWQGKKPTSAGYLRQLSALFAHRLRRAPSFLRRPSNR